MRLGHAASLYSTLDDFGKSAMVSAGPPVPGVSRRLTWATTPNYCAPELFSDFHTLSGDAWSIGLICSEGLHAQPGVCVVCQTSILAVRVARRIG